MHARSASPALAGLLLVVAIIVTACAALASPEPLLPAGAAPTDGAASPGGQDRWPDGAGCSEPGSPDGGQTEPTEPTCAPRTSGLDDPDAVVTSPPLDPGASIPSEPQPDLVKPVPGVFDPRPVAVQSISGAVEADHLIARLEWISGVEPCYSLSTVLVERDGSTFTLTPIEGSTARDVACIDIAVDKATLVDLGILPAGVYTLQAGEGSAPPVTVTVR